MVPGHDKPTQQMRLAPAVHLAPAVRLVPAEWAFIGTVVLAFALLALALGKDQSWDFRNYHWYNPYALLHGRMGFDIGVAHHATYYNPLSDVPFYLLATRIGSWAAIFSLGAAQGLNILPLYLIARAVLAPAQRAWGAPLLAFVCVTGSTALSLTGAVCYDNVVSLLVLSGLALLVIAGERASVFVLVVAGALVGSAVGLRLVEAPFALGFAAAVLAIPGSVRTRLVRGAATGLGGALAVALFGGFWFLALWQATGNPVFPYFNEIFGSPLALGASYRDTRFIPGDLWQGLTFPFRFSFHFWWADDTPFQNLRVLAAYIVVPAAAALWALGRRARDPFIATAGTRILFVFAGASYLAWIAVFAIYRYILVLEMLAPILIVAAVGLLPVSARARTTAILLVLAATTVMARYDPGIRAPLGDPYVQLAQPATARPEGSMVLMTGVEPMAYLIPSFPPAIPFVRIDGWLAGPHDGSGLTALMKARVAAHRGPLMLLASPHERARSEAVGAYGLAIAETECGNISSNLGGPYRLCPLVRKRPHE